MPEIPQQFDSSVCGFGITYWVRPGLLYLIQHSPTQSLACFRRDDGVQERITPDFNTRELYVRALRFAQNCSFPEAENTDCPSISVGIATESDQVFAHVKITEDALEDENLYALKLFLDEVGNQ